MLWTIKCVSFLWLLCPLPQWKSYFLWADWKFYTLYVWCWGYILWVMCWHFLEKNSKWWSITFWKKSNQNINISVKLPNYRYTQLPNNYCPIWTCQMALKEPRSFVIMAFCCHNTNPFALAETRQNKTTEVAVDERSLIYRWLGCILANFKERAKGYLHPFPSYSNTTKRDCTHRRRSVRITIKWNLNDLFWGFAVTQMNMEAKQ